MPDKRSTRQEDDEGAKFMPTPEQIARLAAKERAKRQLPRYVPQYEAGIREYTFQELGLPPTVDIEG